MPPCTRPAAPSAPRARTFRPAADYVIVVQFGGNPERSFPGYVRYDSLCPCEHAALRGVRDAQAGGRAPAGNDVKLAEAALNTFGEQVMGHYYVSTEEAQRAARAKGLQVVRVVVEGV